LLAEYLVVVRPMEIYLSEKFNCKGTKDLREFLWADYKKGLWDGEYLSDQLKLQTSKHGMRALGFREYRQVATAFMEKHLKYRVTDKTLSLESILDRQAGHGGRTVSMSYAVASEDHNAVSRDAMHQYYLASKEWYELLLGLEECEGRAV
jgi:hypothetical protein